MKKYLAAIFVVLISLTGVMLVSDEVFNTDIKNYIFPRKFNSSEWKHAWEVHMEMGGGVGSYQVLEDTHRKMVYSLIRKGVLLGKSKEEVVELIGIESNPLSDDHWNYWLNFTASDSRWLNIQFRNNKVINYLILED